MIRDEDAELHGTEPDQPTWAETNFFGFYNAEERLNVGVYALFRPNLGVVSSTICMNSRRAVTPWEADFCDMRAAMPIPASRSLLDYKLLNSLHVRCLTPNKVWHITYDDEQGTSIDVRYVALMPAFDIHDPEMDPMCGSKSAAGKFSWGTAYNGHFDQTGVFEGKVRIRGREVPIECVSTMDHSWGPRPERGKPNMSWLHAHFSKELAVHGIFGFDQSRNGDELWLAHGYVLENGRVFGLKAGTGAVKRPQERYPEILAAVGVAEDAIVADYLLSGGNMPRMLERFATWPRYRDHLQAMPPQVYAVEEAPIKRFLQEIDVRHGGVRGWALENGIRKEVLARLERELVTDH